MSLKLSPDTSLGKNKSIKLGKRGKNPAKEVCGLF